MLREACFLLLLAWPASTWGQDHPKLPKVFDLSATTLSPDKRYGITVPKMDAAPDEARNILVEARTGHVVAVIQASRVGYDRMNHDEVLPTRWSPDGSVAIWQVDGKWSDSALVVLKLQGDQMAWQANVLKLGQQAILDRTKKAAPKKYAKVQKANGGMGTLAPGELGGTDDPRSAYPGGFSIQVDVVGPLSFPLHVTAELTSEAKPETELYNYLTSHFIGLLDKDGKLTVMSFHLGPARPSHFSED